MKKLTSIFLTAVIVIMSVFSVNAFAQEQTRTEKWIENFNEYEMEILVQNIIDGEEHTSKIYFKGGNIATAMDMPLFGNLSTEMKIIFKDGYAYMYFTNFPLFYVKSEVTDGVILPWDDSYNIADWFVKSYEITENGTTYHVEEFTDEYNSTHKYYFSGDKLVKIESTDIEYGDSSSCTITYGVNDSVFRIPFFSIDITPFFGDIL